MAKINSTDRIKRNTKYIVFLIIPIFLVLIVLWFFFRLTLCWSSSAEKLGWLLACHLSPLSYIALYILALYISYLVVKDIFYMGSDLVPPEEELEVELKERHRIAAFLTRTESFAEKHPKFAKPSRMVAKKPENIFVLLKRQVEGTDHWTNHRGITQIGQQPCLLSYLQVLYGCSFGDQ